MFSVYREREREREREIEIDIWPCRHGLLNSVIKERVGRAFWTPTNISGISTTCQP